MCLSSWHHCEISQPFLCTFVPNTRGHARPCVCLANIIVKFLSPSSVLLYQILEVMPDGLGMRQTVWNMRNLRHKPVRVWTVPCTSTGRIARTHHWSWGGEKKKSCKNKASLHCCQMTSTVFDLLIQTHSLVQSQKSVVWRQKAFWFQDENRGPPATLHVSSCHCLNIKTPKMQTYRSTTWRPSVHTSAEGYPPPHSAMSWINNTHKATYTRGGRTL